MWYSFVYFHCGGGTRDAHGYNIILYPVGGKRVPNRTDIFRRVYPQSADVHHSTSEQFYNNKTRNMYFVLFSSRWSHLYMISSGTRV